MIQAEELSEIDYATEIAKSGWNAQADEFNQWQSLSKDEQEILIDIEMSIINRNKK
jgi:hypothetical protein